tara:strand:+ start:262 stop:462 length:201 start_codon:yes stop_codon:yes gene_type:complete
VINRIEEAYNNMSSITKEDVGFPDNFISLTREQEQFIIDLYFIDSDGIKNRLMQSIEEMKETINDI